jgi:hypothetical protein
MNLAQRTPGRFRAGESRELFAAHPSFLYQRIDGLILPRPVEKVPSGAGVDLTEAHEGPVDLRGAGLDRGVMGMRRLSGSGSIATSGENGSRRMVSVSAKSRRTGKLP